MTLILREAWREASRLLRQARIETAILDAQILLAGSLGITRVSLLANDRKLLSRDDARYYESIIARRVQGEPVSRILGRREFWSLDFGLDPATLDPRPDSEILVQTALTLLPDRLGRYRFLDLGSGTGCLLLALLHERPQAKGIGIDRSDEAVQQAQRNAAHLRLHSQASFMVGDWHRDISGPFDVIISNPPYIPRADITRLAPEVRDFDPLAALDGGEDGLDAYRQIFLGLREKLTPGGHVVMEIGQGQGTDVVALAASHGLACIARHDDLSGIERCLVFAGKDE